MNKSRYLIIAILIGMAIISGCVSKDPQKENVNTVVPTATPEPARVSVPETGGQGEVLSAGGAIFAIVGQVTLSGYSPMTDGPEYSIKLTIQNAAQRPVTFNRIVAKYNDQRNWKTVESNIYPTTLEYAEAIQPTIETAYLREMQDNVEASGHKTIVIHIHLENGDEDISGDYVAALPPLSYMETPGRSHQIFFAKN